ncbi:oxygenase MpaB family protein [Agromyces sp. H3Y2-19a]|uniref:oxygenase MpaB family protein n=1 Tax=Agromyces TaxID=33877 RepID=UPI001E316DB5|nr:MULTISPECIES: oxygenase MpaB family protein [Agromyces]MCD5347142.1 DUF2236 domain-containing protein [Agromyces sp. S2-1-8]MDF0513186.1 oxygenase MpaB family protein [Agromyces chromiiresistens]
MDSDDLLFRRHAAEGVLLLGGGAAILLQLADPRVAHGVARHSDFAHRPLDRLFGTLDYVYAIGFGDDAIVREAVRRVNRRHGPVRNGGGAESPAYSAFDADAQRWVASTILATALTLQERLWGPLDPHVADVVVRGYGELGIGLQAGRAGWPSTRTGFDAWWSGRLATVEVGDEARRIARTLLTASPALPPGSRFLLPFVRLITAALLPPSVRDAYGFRWTPRAERVSHAWLRAVAIAWPHLPASIRHAPMRASLTRASRANRYAGR